MSDIPQHKLEEAAKLQKEVEAFVEKKAVEKVKPGEMTGSKMKSDMESKRGTSKL